MDGGASAHVITDKAAQRLFKEGLIQSIIVHNGDISIEWGGGSQEPVIAIAYTTGILHALYVVKTMHVEMLISEPKLTKLDIIIIKNATTLIGIYQDRIVFYAELSVDNLWMADVKSFFTQQLMESDQTTLSTYLESLLSTVHDNIHSNTTNPLTHPPTNPSYGPIALSAQPTYGAALVRMARRILQSTRASGDQIAAIIQYGAMGNIPPTLTAAVFHALALQQGKAPGWAMTHMKRKVGGGSGIPSDIPGQVARIDHIQQTLEGVVHHALFIIDEATGLWVLIRIIRKVTMGKAIQLYEQSIVIPAGHTLQDIRADSESTLSMDLLKEVNESAGGRYGIREPLSAATWTQHQLPPRGISINKVAAEVHEKAAERNIQTCYDNAIYNMIMQPFLSAKFFLYAAMSAAETHNGMIGRLGNISRHQHFYGKVPDFLQWTQGTFGQLVVTPRPVRNRDVEAPTGKWSRAQLAVRLVAPLSHRDTSLVLLADSSIPVMRSQCVGISPLCLKRTAMDWKLLEPKFDEQGNIIEIKAGTRDIFTVGKALQEYQKDQFGPDSSSALTPAQEERLAERFLIVGKKPLLPPLVNDPPQNPIPPIPPIPPILPIPIQPIPPLQPVDEVMDDADVMEEVVDKEMEEDMQAQDNDEKFTTDHEQVGVRVAGMWDGQLYDGSVTAVLPAHTDAEGNAYEDIFRLIYEDGDIEEVYGLTALQQAKQIYLDRYAKSTSAGERQSARIRARTQAFSSRLTQPQVAALMRGDDDMKPWTDFQGWIEPVQPLLHEQDFVCMPTATHDEAGMLRCDKWGQSPHPVVSHSPPLITNPIPPNLSPSQQLLFDEMHWGEDFGADATMVSAVAAWKESYNDQPSRSNLDGLQQLCTLIGRVPTVSEIHQHFDYSPPTISFDTYWSDISPPVRALKARVQRTNKNPTLSMIQKNEALTARYLPVIRKVIDGGIAENIHRFITEEEAVLWGVTIVTAVYVFGEKLSDATMRITPHGGEEPESTFRPYSRHSTGVDMPSVRWFFAQSGDLNLKITTSDISSAFPRHNHIDSPHTENKRLIAVRIPAFVSGTGKPEILLFLRVTHGQADASAVLRGKVSRGFFESEYSRSMYRPDVYIRRLDSSISLLLNYVDDNSKAFSRDAGGEQMESDLMAKEKEMGFGMKYSLPLDEAALTYLSWKINIDNDAELGPSIHIRNGSILDALQETLLLMPGTVKGGPTFAALLPGWTAMASLTQQKLGKVQPLSAAGIELYQRAMGQVQWTEGLTKDSTLASQLGSRMVHPNDWDLLQMKNFIQNIITMSFVPVVYAIRKGADTRIPSRLEADVDGGINAGNTAEVSKIAVVITMGPPGTISAPSHIITKSEPGSSNTATCEVYALAEGATQLVQADGQCKEVAGHHPGILNNEPSLNPFMASIINTTSMIPSLLGSTARLPREIFLDLEKASSSIINCDNQTVVTMMQADGKVSTAKQLRECGPRVRRIQWLHLNKNIIVTFKSGITIRANPLTKLPPGPLQHARDMHMIRGQSRVLIEHVAAMEQRYAKLPRDPVTMPMFMAMTSQEPTPLYTPYHQPPTTDICRSFPTHHSDQSWVTSISNKVLRMLDRSGYQSDRQQLLSAPVPLPPSRRLGRDGIGYDGMSYGNTGRHGWVQGQSTEPITVPAPALQPVQVDSEELWQDIRDTLTATNTLINSSATNSDTALYLINGNHQDVLAVNSVDNIGQLRALEAYQQQLQQQIKQHHQPSQKRSLNSDNNHLTALQQRIKAEEHMRPSYEFFGSISESSERRYCRRYQPHHNDQQSKQQCQLAPSFQSHHSFHHGSVGSPSQHQLDYQRQASVISPTGGSFGSGQNGGRQGKERRPRSKNDISKKEQRTQQFKNNSM